MKALNHHAHLNGKKMEENREVMMRERTFCDCWFSGYDTGICQYLTMLRQSNLKIVI